ncbi:MAG: 4Fe-4S ferredoxin [Gemmatimonadetes bacterium]|nr:4Fe-4S ferredoxin [Gemmatimonadota bacterium]
MSKIRAEEYRGSKEDTPIWGKVLDHTRCIGCHACTTACKSENSVPLSVTRTYVKYVDVGRYPQTRRSFQVTRCNQCSSAPCVPACPTSAMFARDDGIIDFDKSSCIGCKACIAACPYDAIFINPEDNSAEKCNFCAHRIDVGLEPACVVVCPTQAILVGDITDPLSEVNRIIARQPVTVRKPEKDTRPKVHYKGVSSMTLDPLAAKRPEGGLFMWSEQGSDPHKVTSGHPGSHNSSAAAVLSYDVPHSAPWDWRVSLYTWTKSIAAGAYIVPVALIMLGLMTGSSPVWKVGTPFLGSTLLAVTGALLIWDLEHPGRFYMIFTRPQWSSWLVRGGLVIGAYGIVLGTHGLMSWLGEEDLLLRLAWLGFPAAVMTAVYTAYLFAQAKARDLWQNPLLPVHFFVQSVIAGAGVLALSAILVNDNSKEILISSFLIGSVVHLFMVFGEFSLPHASSHGRMAVDEILKGKLRSHFWLSILLSCIGLLAPWVGGGALICGLMGLAMYEHVYVQAGQVVPLA